jgi:hypothetical protein
VLKKNISKERNKKTLARSSGQRKSCDRILIVTEGTKTEPNYFNDMRKDYKLPTASVCICPSSSGTAPRNVVEYAEQLFLKGNQHKGLAARAFEQVYAVFDRDNHDTYAEAIKKAKNLNKKHANDIKQQVKFAAIPSNPCFELWLLLHFMDVSSPLTSTEVMKQIKKQIPGYDKSRGDIFQLIASQLDQACKRADRLIESNSADNGQYPYTYVHNLVKVLLELKK